MDHTRRFFSILSEPAAVRFITRLLAALAAFEMLEVFFGCSFSLRLPLLLLLSALLLAGELSGRPVFGFFSCAVLTLSVSLLFMAKFVIFCRLVRPRLMRGKDGRACVFRDASWIFMTFRRFLPFDFGSIQKLAGPVSALNIFSRERNDEFSIDITIPEQAARWPRPRSA